MIYKNWNIKILLISCIALMTSGCSLSRKMNEYIGSSEPYEWNLNILIGNKKLQSGKYNEALTHYNKRIINSPKNSIAWLGKGMANVELNNYTEAIKAYNKAIILQPENSYYYVKRGVAKRKQKDFKGALADFSTAIEIEGLNNVENLNQDFLYYYVNSSMVKESLGDFKGALKDLKRAYLNIR